MSTKRLILLVLVAGSVVGLYLAGAPASPPPLTAPGEKPGVKVALSGLPARLGHGAGMVGSRIVAPAVRKMVTDNEKEIELLRADLRRVQAPSLAANSARAAVKQVQAMDSTALASLADGHPVRAFQGAMQASGLVAGVRDNLRVQ